MGISTHVLDAAHGRPASGVAVRLEQRTDDGTYAEIGRATTDADGRVRTWTPEGAWLPGTYRLVFDTGAYFAERGENTFYPEVAVTFAVTAPEEPHHVPLLLSPYAYSTYRGS